VGNPALVHHPWSCFATDGAAVAAAATTTTVKHTAQLCVPVPPLLPRSSFVAFARADAAATSPARDEDECLSEEDSSLPALEAESCSDLSDAEPHPATPDDADLVAFDSEIQTLLQDIIAPVPASGSSDMAVDVPVPPRFHHQPPRTFPDCIFD